MVKTIYWDNGTVRMLDQTRLPLEVAYIDCTDPETVAEGIRSLRIRGAPAIGIAAAMGLALAARRVKAPDPEAFRAALEPARDLLLSTRPTAVNIRWALDRMWAVLEAGRDRPVGELPGLLEQEARAMLEEDVRINRAIGEAGAAFIRDGATVLTHCNAGSLATGGYGTATAPIRVALEQGKRVRVVADETRPVLQGARLTAWELMQDGIEVTLIPDGAAGSLIRRGRIDLAIVGTDRTARNGDVANKIGTYPVAVLCRENRVPFYVAAPLSSIDFSMATGDEIPIEERDAGEVTSVLGRCRIAPEGVRVWNPAFDVTPARYVTAFFTERGAVAPGDLHRLSDPDAPVDGFRLDRPAAPKGQGEGRA